MGVSILGNLFGFLLGSACAAIPTNINDQEMSESNPGYIGSWWLGKLNRVQNKDNDDRIEVRTEEPHHNLRNAFDS